MTASLLRQEIKKLLCRLYSASELALEAANHCLASFAGKEDPKSSMDEVKHLSRELIKRHEEIRREAIALIARFQPMASDLRTIASILEVSYGLVRLGRYSEDISEVIESFGSIESCALGIALRTWEITKEMVSLALKAMEDMDVDMAKRVIEMDDLVDRSYDNYVKRVVGGGEKSPLCAVAITLILRYLERMADHAVMIAEGVVYIRTGKYCGHPA